MILTKDLTKRPSAQEILDHPWMKDVNVDEVMDLVEPLDHTEEGGLNLKTLK